MGSSTSLSVVFFPARHRTEQSRVSGAVAGGDTEDFFAPLLNLFADAHLALILSSSTSRKLPAGSIMASITLNASPTPAVLDTRSVNMRTKVIAFAALLAASLASAQTGARPTNSGKVFAFANKPNVQGLEEIGAILRKIGDIQQVSLDPAASTVTVQGTPDQLGLSGWLIQTLDVPAGARVSPPAGAREYRFAGDNVVGVFYLSNQSTPRQVQEILMVLRTVVGQRASPYTSQNALVVRCAADAMALVEKLLSDISKPV
jgi:type II secretory pathway component GspD/PulD (secretin)